MLTLMLLRHAKSAWDDPDLDDHERPLSKRGARDAPRMGRYLAENDLVPDAVLCSSAVRTRATLALLLAAIGEEPPEIAVEDGIYLATPQQLMGQVRALKPAARRAMVIGHNPGLHALALELTAGGEKRHIKALAMGFPTCALAVLTFEVSRWSEVHAATGRLAAYVTPQHLD